MYFMEYRTPIIGTLTVASDGENLTGCWFDNDRHFGPGAGVTMERREDLAVFDQARAWLDRYFAGEAPDPRELPLQARGTEFQLRVRKALLAIPYGQTTTYGAIAQSIASETGRRQSPRAVGGAIARNPLVVIVPCHRVVASNNSLTGFGGGIDTKVALLKHEGAMKDSFTRPSEGTALEGVPNASRMGRGAEYVFADLGASDMHAIMESRDETFSGVFVVGVTSTGIYCQPGCRAHVPVQQNSHYFATAEEAEAAGFRSCTLCHPKEPSQR